MLTDLFFMGLSKVWFKTPLEDYTTLGPSTRAGSANYEGLDTGYELIRNFARFWVFWIFARGVRKEEMGYGVTSVKYWW